MKEIPEVNKILNDNCQFDEFYGDRWYWNDYALTLIFNKGVVYIKDGDNNYTIGKITTIENLKLFFKILEK